MRLNPSHPYLENDPAPSFAPTICAFHLGFSLGCGILAEASEERWLAAAVIFRPMFDRALYALAVVISPNFLRKWRECQSNDTNSRSRPLIEEARGIVNRWYTEQGGKGSLIQNALDINRVASELIHSISGLSRQIAASPDRRGEIVVAYGEYVRSALSSILTALEYAD